jgi:16S rRNA processing protein RimM
MDAVTLGIVGRPHGFRGAFVVSTPSGKESALPFLKNVYIGASKDALRSFHLREAAWMPRGWKVVVEELSSDAEVSSLIGQTVYARREDLPETKSDEFYVHDLIGAKVLDSETSAPLGNFLAAEDVGGDQHPFGQERWWIETESVSFSVPATKHYIDRVDTKGKTIYLKNYKELLS